jgi:hypothetical protein
MDNKFKIKHDKQWILEKILPDGTKLFTPRTTIKNGVTTKHYIEYNQAIRDQHEEWKNQNKQKHTKLKLDI